MPRLRPIDGRELIKILCNKFGFVKVRQKGSQVTLQRNGISLPFPPRKYESAS